MKTTKSFFSSLIDILIDLLARLYTIEQRSHNTMFVKDEKLKK